MASVPSLQIYRDFIYWGLIKNEISIIYKLVSRTAAAFIPLSEVQSTIIKGYTLIVIRQFFYKFYCH